MLDIQYKSPYETPRLVSVLIELPNGKLFMYEQASVAAVIDEDLATLSEFLRYSPFARHCLQPYNVVIPHDSNQVNQHPPKRYELLIPPDIAISYWRHRANLGNLAARQLLLKNGIPLLPL